MNFDICCKRQGLGQKARIMKRDYSATGKSLGNPAFAELLETAKAVVALS